MTNQETVTQQRKQYLDGNITHESYYLWLSDFLEIPGNMIPFSKEQIKNSKDPHLNDLSLSAWESRHISINRLSQIKKVNLSLLETVCCLKAMARQWVNEK